MTRGDKVWVAIGLVLAPVWAVVFLLTEMLGLMVVLAVIVFAVGRSIGWF